MFFSESPRIAETSGATQKARLLTHGITLKNCSGKAASWEVNRSTWKNIDMFVKKYRMRLKFPEFSIMEMGPKWNDDPLWRAHIFQVPQPPISFRFFGSPTYSHQKHIPFNNHEFTILMGGQTRTTWPLSSILPSLQESKEESLGCHVGEFGRTTSALCRKPGWFQSSSGSSFPI